MTTMELLQVPRHWVIMRQNLSGDDRPWGKDLGGCECTGVRRDTSESDKIGESKEGHFRKDREINWEYDFTWERAIPDSSFFPLPPLPGFFLRQYESLKSTFKVEKMVFNAWNQHTRFLSHHHTHREDLSMRNRQSPAAHGPRRDSGQ